MKMRVVIPGQPPSANSQYVRRPGGLQMAKREEVATYANGVALLVRTARPIGFLRPGPGQPQSQVRLVFDFYLSRPVDADNMLKVLNDAIAQGLGVDDRIFLPCVRSLITKIAPRLARTEIEIEWPA